MYTSKRTREQNKTLYVIQLIQNKILELPSRLSNEDEDDDGDDEDWKGFVGHGLCLLSKRKSQISRGELIAFVLFGGLGNKPFCENILRVTIQMNENDISKIDSKNFEQSIVVQAQKYLEDISFIDENSKSLAKQEISQFGHEMIRVDDVTSGKEQRIILIVGGERNSKNILVWNYDTRQVVSVCKKRDPQYNKSRVRYIHCVVW